jgi:hypothetical protein
MAHQYFHRTCHITAIVEDRPEPTPAARARRRATPRRAEEPVAPAEPVAVGPVSGAPRPSGAPQASNETTEGDS